MQILTYVNKTKLSCSCVTTAPIFVCLVDPARLLVPKGGLEATLSAFTEVLGVCDEQNYMYSLAYDESLLLDPTKPLTCADISGIVCEDGCLLTYVKFLIDQAIAAQFAPH